ncbi:Eco47II family restriction endonuclease [Spiroplasma chrysopicola]|uniref:Type II restriction enzyme n=1 Tax=Spiroplasma chrysopicola DF-1 TaxID=1276227 RepID=R4UH53_9MOLU|nr:Eco47II family restriction endonuclease [Spiroplasma chrysopicola]AGM24641.1 type II restriction enzyme [Spiroplasma chrysopicola DF-1]
MERYELNFISQSNLEKHIRNTILKYSESINGINLKQFNSNIVDPIKMLFDSLVFKKDIEDIIESEIIRQKDKSNNNIIGYFHQNLFKYINNSDWIVPKTGFDIENINNKIFVEMKNKHNTMNASSSQKTYINMLNKIANDSEAKCFLVEIIAKKSQNIIWELSLDGKKNCNERIKRISIDKFYEIVTGDKLAFYKLCNTLKWLIKKVIDEMPEFNKTKEDTVIIELKNMAQNNLMNSLFFLAFNTYYGWKEEDYLTDNYKIS